MLASTTKQNPSELIADDDKQRALELLPTYYPNIGALMQAMGKDYSKYYQWRAQDPDFARRVKEIEEICLDKIEGNLWEQGINNKKAIIPMIFILKNKRAHIYGEKLDVTSQNTNLDLTEQAKRTIERVKNMVNASTEYVPVQGQGKAESDDNDRTNI